MYDSWKSEEPVYLSAYDRLTYAMDMEELAIAEDNEQLEWISLEDSLCGYPDTVVQP